MAFVFHLLLGWDMHVSIWVSAGAIGCYITLGGLLSAIFTEIVQFFLIWFGLFLVSLLGVFDLGGLDQVFTGLPDNMAGLWSTAGSADANAMGVTWADVASTLYDLASFVRDSGLPYGVGHEAEITDAFVERARSRIEAVYGPWKGDLDAEGNP